MPTTHLRTFPGTPPLLRRLSREAGESLWQVLPAGRAYYGCRVVLLSAEKDRVGVVRVL